MTNLITDAAGRKLAAPQWSPSGAKIAFQAGRVASDLRDYIDTILPAGTGRMTLTSSNRSVRVFAPRWSPDSNFVAYERIDTSTNHSDIYKVTATATGDVNLTADVPSVTLFGWR